MPRRGTKGRKNIILLSAIFLISFVLMTVNVKRGKGPVFFETFAMWVVDPIQNMLTQSVNAVSDMFDHYFFLVNVARENEKLQIEIDRLKQEQNVLQEEIKSWERISKLISPLEYTERSSLVATIVAYDATQWSKMVFIDKGTKDGVQENFPVVTHAGVIGHVIQAGRNSSKVLLITDSRSAVDSLFKESRISGVVVGTGRDSCDMKYVPITAEVKVGDQVLSSGLGGIFPKGMMVGTVSKVVRKKQGLFQTISVSPSADLSRLEEVLVLLSPESG
ncbi:MAG: rod shape-determining protein MreC [Nitrospinae bacterium CG11_big_fil_rev_8_21_14_0_20_56_8]|nr:MAG: rod shape-determining protein MreC [Nitrospinae bacterium CG11_big_fil_rev_8_21_14_0_20_56_8]